MNAQDQNANSALDDNQGWGAIQAGIPIQDKTDLIVTGAFRLGRDWRVPVYEQGGISLQYHWKKYLILGPVYQFIAHQPLARIHTLENRLSFSCTVLYQAEKITLSNINQFEERLIHSGPNSQRYRNRTQLEFPLKLKNIEIRGFAADEISYDFRLDRLNRNRLFAGGSRKLTENLSLDIYYMRQWGSLTIPRNLNVAGATLRFKLDWPYHQFPE